VSRFGEAESTNALFLMVPYGKGHSWLKVVALAVLGFAILFGFMILADWYHSPWFWYPFEK